MNNKDLEIYYDKAFAEFRKELLEHHTLPVMLIACEVESPDAEVIQLCTKAISCEEMVKCLNTAIKNCRKEMLTNKIMKSGLN